MRANLVVRNFPCAVVTSASAVVSSMRTLFTTSSPFVTTGFTESTSEDSIPHNSTRDAKLEARVVRMYSSLALLQGAAGPSTSSPSTTAAGDDDDFPFWFPSFRFGTNAPCRWTYPRGWEGSGSCGRTVANWVLPGIMATVTVRIGVRRRRKKKYRLI